MASASVSDLVAALAKNSQGSASVKYDPVTGEPIYVDTRPDVMSRVLPSVPVQRSYEQAPAGVPDAQVNPDYIDAMPEPGSEAALYAQGNGYQMPVPQPENMPDNSSLADRQAIWGPTGMPPQEGTDYVPPQFDVQQTPIDEVQPRNGNATGSNWMDYVIGGAAGATGMAGLIHVLANRSLKNEARQGLNNKFGADDIQQTSSPHQSHYPRQMQLEDQRSNRVYNQPDQSSKDYLITDQRKMPPQTDDVIYAQGAKHQQGQLPAPQKQLALPAPNQKALPAPPVQSYLPSPDTIYSSGPTYPEGVIYSGGPVIPQITDQNAAGRARAAAGYKRPMPEPDLVRSLLAQKFRVTPNQIREGANIVKRIVR